MDFLESVAAKRTAEIRKLKPKKGMWAQATSEYGDVWHEIESVYLCNTRSKFFSKDWSSMRLYCHRKNAPPIENSYFNHIRKVVNKLPKDARVIMCKEGYFSERSGSLDKLPERVVKQYEK